MVIITSTVSLPPELVAVTVYAVAVVDSTEGLPLITPEVVSNARPVGSAGLIAYDTTGPPSAMGELSLMAVPMVYTLEGARYRRLDTVTEDTKNAITRVSTGPLKIYVTQQKITGPPHQDTHRHSQSQ